MVVAPPRVAGHRRPGDVAGRLALVVVEGDTDDGARAGKHPRGIEALAGAAGEIAHGRAVAGLQPPRERGTMLWRRRGADGDAVEAQLESTGLDGLAERGRGEHHDRRALTMRCARVRVRPPCSRKAM